MDEGSDGWMMKKLMGDGGLRDGGGIVDGWMMKELIEGVMDGWMMER